MKLTNLLKETKFSKKSLKEAEQELSPAEASKKMKELVKDPKFQKSMEKFWSDLKSKMTPEELSKFEKNVMSIGINESSLHEDSFSKAFDIAKEKAEALLEDWGDTSVTSFGSESTPNKTVHNAGKIISAVGKVGASMVPAALVAAKLGVGAWGLGLGAVMAASLLAGAALWWIGDKIKEKFSNESKISEDDETSFLTKGDFDAENLDAGDLLEYDLVLDDLMAIIKKYKWIPNLDKGVIAKQILHDKKLVANAIKKQKQRNAIRKDFTPKKGRY